MSLLILGEAYGEEEERQRLPFVGASGYELTRMLEEAGIHRADCYLTNVFNLRPPGNKIETLCGPKAEGIEGYPYLLKGKYVRKEFEPELDRLGDEILEINPNLILLMGNTASWALTGKTAISKNRGTTDISSHTVSGYKVLPTYHPAAVLRQWELRPTTVIDLMKAARERQYPEIRRPKRKIYIPETVEDIHEFAYQFISDGCLLSVDIETSGNQITCIGFSPRKDIGLVVPIVDGRRKDRSYWADAKLEQAVWEFIGRTLGNSRIGKTFQNGMYDIAFLWRSYGIKVYGAEHDTMLLHHALQPESLKGLGYLGSIYCDEGAWKTMRAKTQTIKRDE